MFPIPTTGPFFRFLGWHRPQWQPTHLGERFQFLGWHEANNNNNNNKNPFKKQMKPDHPLQSYYKWLVLLRMEKRNKIPKLNRKKQLSLQQMNRRKNEQTNELMNWLSKLYMLSSANLWKNSFRHWLLLDARRLHVVFRPLLLERRLTKKD